jgi:hypothetical protein
VLLDPPAWAPLGIPPLALVLAYTLAVLVFATIVVMPAATAAEPVVEP